MMVFNIQENHRFVWRGSHLPHVTLMLASEIARAVIELVRERIHITYNTSTRERIGSPSLTLQTASGIA